jgi:putative tricarboxylic transport membrane protein
MLADISTAFIAVMTWQTFLAVAAGTMAGLIIGAIPGLSATMGMALLSPFTFFMPPLIGIPFLIGVFKGGTFGGSISAILIGTPGTAANAATLADGYALRNKGRAGEALSAALNASLIGDLFGTIALVIGAPMLALVAIRFGPHEFFALVLFSLTMVCYVSGNSLAKGVLAATVGLVFALIGTDPIAGTQRLTFGISDLQGGLNIIALVTGLFGISEVLVQLEASGTDRTRAVERVDFKRRRVASELADIVKHLPTIVRSSLIGTFIGALPGIGSETSPWIAYGVAKRRSKTPEKFGEGSLEGVMAPEAANNAVCASAMIPMLVFGIPGDIVTAILMSALIAQGLQPGPFLIVDHRDVIYGLFISVFLSSIALYVLGRLTMRWWITVLSIPKPLLYAIIVAFCVVGTYSVKSSEFDLAVMLLFGVIGYGFRKLNIALAPMLLAFVLSKYLETSLRHGLVQSDGSLFAFFERPITAVILVLTVLMLATFVLAGFRRRK